MPGLYTFQPGAQRPGTVNDVQLLESQLEQMRKLADSLQRHAPLGSDDALKAGFDPADPTKVDELSKRVQSLARQAQEVEKGIEMTQTAFQQLEKSREVVDGRLPDDEANRRQACLKVIRFLVNSPTEFHTLLRGLGVEVTEEIKEALDNASRRGLSDSQAGQWLDATQEERRRMRIRTQEIEDQLQKLEEDLKAKCDTIGELYDEREDARDVAREERRARTTAERDTDRARQERDRLRDAVMQAQRDNEADKKSIDQLQQDNSGLGQQVQQLTQALSSAQSGATEAQNKAQRLEAELSALKGQLTSCQRTVEEANATIKALREQGAKDREEGAASKNAANAAEELNRKLNGEKVDLSVERDRLQRELNKAVRSSTSLQGDRDALSRENGTLQQELSTAVQLTAELRNEKAALEQDISKLQESSHFEQRKALEDFGKVAARAGQAEKTCGQLQEEVSRQRQTLDARVSEIRTLTEASTERENQFSRKSEAQVQQAAALLRHLSIGTESDIWKGLAQETLHDLTWLATQETWHPWRIVPSWSTDEALDVRVDDRSVHAAALDVLAILRSGSASVVSLLSRLQVLQNGLVDSPSVVSSMAEMLLAAFIEAVEDARLHLMHRLAIWQVVLEIFPVAHVQATLGKALNEFDNRIVNVANVMRGWDSGDPTEFSSTMCVAYPGIGLLGFGRNPPGVLAFSRSRRELCWVDIARIHQSHDKMELVPLTGTAMHLPLDNEERMRWAFMNA